MKKDLVSVAVVAIVVQFAGIAALWGLFRAYGYTATAQDAFSSYQGLPGWVKNASFWLPQILIVQTLALTLTLAGTGRTAGHDRGLYLGSLVMVAFAMVFQLIGNLLPFDRHGVQTAAIEGGIIQAVPLVGPALARLVMGGDGFNDRTIEGWMLARSLAVGALVVFAVSWGALRARTRGTELAFGQMVALILVAGSCLLPCPTGSAAQVADYTAFDARPGWYTWPMHGALVFFNQLGGVGWIGTALLPGLAGLGLLSLAFWGDRIPRDWSRFALLAFLGFYGFVGIFYGGSIAPLGGNRDPKSEVVVPPKLPKAPQDKALAETGAGLFRAQGCNGCHGEQGLKGKFAPSLATTYRKHGDAAFYMKYIKRPTSVDSGSTMPAFPSLSEAELRALAEYLRFPR